MVTCRIRTQAVLDRLSMLAYTGHAVVHDRSTMTNVMSLKEIRLLHDAQELLLVYLSVAVTVRLVNHLLELFIRHPLTKLLGHALQVFERNLSSFVIIKEPESLQDLILRVAVEDLLRHHRHELRKLNGARPVVIHVLDHLLDLFLLRFEPERAHG